MTTFPREKTHPSGAAAKADRRQSRLGKLTPTPWREEALAKAFEMLSLLKWFQVRAPKVGSNDIMTPEEHAALCEEVQQQLGDVIASAHGTRYGMAALNGAAFERTFSILNAAEANVLRLAPLQYVCSVFPGLLANAEAALPDGDPRLVGLSQIAKRDGDIPLTSYDRDLVVSALEATNAAARKEQLRVRSFRNVIIATATLAAFLAVVISGIALSHASLVPLCFQPQNKVVCPIASTVLNTGDDAQSVTSKTVSGWDAGIVMFFGMLGAVIAAATAMRGMRGSADPYSLPVALALLKLPMGALTAFLGILLIRAGFVPGLSALDSSAQIIAWSIVLGYAQQLFTRLVDSQAKTVLAQSESSTSSRSD